MEDKETFNTSIEKPEIGLLILGKALSPVLSLSIYKCASHHSS